jgi:tricorn protease
MSTFLRRSSLSLALTVAPLSAHAIDIRDTRLIADPAVSAQHLAFAYANDLWVANRDGSGVRRLTSHPGVESGPRFSPDGRLIAFTGRYEGNTDAYVVPVEGGIPRRLTWHPLPDNALGFTPDGRQVLFASGREVYTGRYQQLFTVSVDGGWPTKLPIPNASKAAISPDGKTIAYLPLYEAFRQWKHYRGGTHARLLLFDMKSLGVEQVPQPAGRCNDTDPVWAEGKLLFRSDRDGEFNVYSYDPTARTVTRLTRHTDFPVLGLSAAGGRIVYEQAGYLHALDAKGGTATRLSIGVPADLLEPRPRFVKGTKYVRSASLSPSGTRAAFEFRGEVITLPREKGDDRNLTRSQAVHERAPVWSPDGSQLAFFSDAGGEYALHIATQEGRGTPRKIPLEGAGFYEEPRWSPDGKKISYVDNARTLWILDVASGKPTKVDTEPIYGPIRALSLHHAWSPDSQWLAYNKTTPTYINRIWLFSLAQKKNFPLTDGMSDSRNPVFDPNGKYLYFLASTDAGPVQDWFSMANADMRATQSIYLTVLAKGVASPLARESDEEGAKKPQEPKEEERRGLPSGGDKSDEQEKDTGAATGTAATGRAKPPLAVKIDVEGLSQRILAMPPKPAGYSQLQIAASGKLLYLKVPGGDRGGEASLQRYDLEKRKEDTILEKADFFRVSNDGKRLLVRVKDAWSISDLADKLDTSKHKLNVDAVQVKIDPLAEWKQIFDEAWRINRDYFYDPGMHGADWKAMRARYLEFLPHVATRQDLNRVMQWMFSELAVGHHNVGGGDTLADVETVPGGLLGADYSVENGRYRFRKVYGGLNWDPDLRAPLTEPGVDVQAGEYLLAVEGVDLRPPDDLHARFERTAGRIVEITVGANPDGTGSRTVKVVPIENENSLRNRDWVESNVRKVTEATKGRVAYVYVPNTSTLGHTYFKRYFYPQADREAIIVDERHNGGGQVADYYIDILRRPLISFWAMRYGADLKTPIAGIHGPKVMLIDETAGSGGDLLPWMFRKLKLGTLVGKRTWGGLVGILGFPVLMDGGFVTAPNLAIWTEDGFIVENEGVPPDVEVEQTPKDVIAGRDPQLEKAIEIALRELGENGQGFPKRPPFPKRVRAAN